MAKKKHHRPVPQKTPVKKTTRTEQDRCCLAAKKVLLNIELEPELLDIFTKKQKQTLFMVCFGLPVIKPEREQTVPRQYIRKIHEETYQFMKNNCWGNPENELTYLEFAVYGLSFVMNMLSAYTKGGFMPGTPQEETAKRIYEKLEGYKKLDTAFSEVFNQVWFLAQSYSKVNFRLYGFKYTYDILPSASGSVMRIIMLLTARDCESKTFTSNGIERKAFRVFHTDDGLYKTTPAMVKRNMIFPDAKDDEYLNIYIQSHVLHRYSERMDVFSPLLRNLFLQYAFTRAIQLVTVEKRILFASLIEDDMPVGYFTFFVQESDLVINTFLPLVSENTPEGNKLHKILALTKDEIVYLGMDKVGFFLKVDFEQIPVLKQALIDSDIWPTKLILDRMSENEESEENEEETTGPDKTMFVKNYFEKRENYDY